MDGSHPTRGGRPTCSGAKSLGEMRLIKTSPVGGRTSNFTVGTVFKYNEQYPRLNSCLYSFVIII